MCCEEGSEPWRPSAKTKGKKGKELLGDRETKIANVSVLSGELWLGDVAKHGCRKNVKENCHSIVTAMWMTRGPNHLLFVTEEKPKESLPGS